MFRKVVHTLFTQLGGSLALVLFGVVLARSLGPGGRGIVSYAWTVLGFALMFAEGQAAAVVSQYAREKVRRGTVHAASLRVLGILVIPSIAILVILALVFPSQRVMIAAACALPFALYAQIAKALLIAEGRVQAANIVDVITNAGYAALGAALLFAGAGIAGAIAAWIVAYIAASIVGAALVGRVRGRDDASGEVHVAALSRSQFILAGRSGFVYVAGYVNLRIDVFIVMTLLGSTALGIYTLATGTAELLWKISNAIAWSAFGHIAGDEDVALRILLPRITRSVILVECLLGAAVFALGPALMSAVYGTAFEAAGVPLRVLLLGIAAYAVEPVLGYFLLVRQRRPMTVFWIQIASSVLCGGAALVLIPRFGLAGAAAASTVTYAGVVAVKAWLVARALGISVSELIVPRSDDARAIAGRIMRVVRRSPAPPSPELAA